MKSPKCVQRKTKSAASIFYFYMYIFYDFLCIFYQVASTYDCFYLQSLKGPFLSYLVFRYERLQRRQWRRIGYSNNPIRSESFLVFARNCIRSDIKNKREVLRSKLLRHIHRRTPIPRMDIEQRQKMVKGIIEKIFSAVKNLGTRQINISV